MAKIVLSDKAPEGAKFFSLASDEIEVPFETNDSEILSNAGVHPWLKVERDEVEVDDFEAPARLVFPADDPANSLANDPEAVAEERERREVEFSQPTAIDAGLDQGEVEFVGDEDHEVAVTLAADESRDDDAEETDSPESIDSGNFVPPVEDDESAPDPAPVEETEEPAPAPVVEPAPDEDDDNNGGF
jgi:hypothetical protein